MTNVNPVEVGSPEAGGQTLTPTNWLTPIPIVDPTEMKLRRIMLVTDFSAKSRNMYAHAVRFAKRFGSSIHLVHFGSKRAPEYSGITDKQHLKSQYQSLATESKQNEFLDLPVKTCLLELRDLGGSLNAYQEQFKCGLVISHTLALHGLKRHFDHQLAEKIVAKSSVPVLLFGPAAITTGVEEPKAILVPFDFSDKAIATFPLLRFLSSHYDCSIRLLFVQGLRSQWFKKITGANSYQIKNLEKHFDELIAEELPNLDVELEICQGLPEFELGFRASNAAADLILIGTYGSLGQLTKSIIRQAKCPVMAIPSDR